MTVLFDSNILIDHLGGVGAATDTLRTYHDGAISIVTRIETLAGPAEQDTKARQLLSTMRVLPLTQGVADAAAVIRRDLRLRLPDAVVLATARMAGMPLITRDERDFGGLVEVRIPYRL